MGEEKEERCFCMEIMKEKYDDVPDVPCLKSYCARYRREHADFYYPEE